MLKLYDCVLSMLCLAYVLILTRGDRAINVIPDVYRVPSGEKGSLFGAGLSLKGQAILAAAPYWKQNGAEHGQIFVCPLTGSKQCYEARPTTGK